VPATGRDCLRWKLRSIPKIDDWLFLKKIVFE